MNMRIKLVRDNIPGAFNAPENQKLNLLHNKIIEECNELINAKEIDHITEELADVITVLQALQKYHNINSITLKEVLLKKEKERGGFYNNKIIIIKD